MANNASRALRSLTTTGATAEATGIIRVPTGLHRGAGIQVLGTFSASLVFEHVRQRHDLGRANGLSLRRWGGRHDHDLEWPVEVQSIRRRPHSRAVQRLHQRHCRRERRADEGVARQSNRDRHGRCGHAGWPGAEPAGRGLRITGLADARQTRRSMQRMTCSPPRRAARLRSPSPTSARPAAQGSSSRKRNSRSTAAV